MDLDDRAETPSSTWIRNPGGSPYVETRLRPAVVGFCSGCEFAVEIRPDGTLG